jgi:hypothetical protein
MIRRRSLLQGALGAFAFSAVHGDSHANKNPALSVFNISDPITTASGELTWVVWRKYFFGKASVRYAISAGTAVLGIDCDETLDHYTGMLNFSNKEIWKEVRLQTKPGGARGNRTLICTLSSPTGGTIGRATGTGTIQSGTVYYIAADGVSGNDGLTPSAPKDIGSLNALMSVAKTTGAGRLIRIKRGDGFLSGAWHTDCSMGGTTANPMIIGAYGTGINPILVLSKQISAEGLRGGDNSNSGFIVEDLIFRPHAIAAVNWCVLAAVNGGDTPCRGWTFQRCIINNPVSNPGFGTGIFLSRCAEFKILFCEIDGCEKIGILSGNDTDTEIIGNYIHDNGTSATHHWGLYLKGNGTYVHANRLEQNKGGIKLRASHDIEIKWNYVDSIDNGRVNVGGGGEGGSPGRKLRLLERCVFEHNVIKGCAGFLFGEADNAEAGITRCILDTVVRNNLILLNRPNQTKTTLGVGLFILTKFNEGLEFVNNTVIVDGENHGMLDCQSRQDIAPVIIKNNIFKRTNKTNATMYLLQAGQEPDSGAAALANYEIDYNLWDDSTSDRFARISLDANYDELALFKAAYPTKEIHGLQTPLMLSDYHGIGDVLPAQNSLAVARGAKLVSDDFMGRSRPADSEHTIGALELGED